MPSGGLAVTEIWQPLNPPGNLTERIVTRIEEYLDADGIEAGRRLPAEREMARMLGVSRPALREAVKVLEARGLLVVRHGQGTFVARTVEEDVAARLTMLEVSLRELFDMRMVLEEPAAAWAAEVATTQDIASLAEALASEEAARAGPIDFNRLGSLDEAFHLGIVQAAQNRFLRQTLDVLQKMLAAGMETTLTVPGRIWISIADHRKIFEAIVARDPDAARLAVHAHISGTREAAMARIKEQALAAGRPVTPAGPATHADPPGPVKAGGRGVQRVAGGIPSST